MQRKHARERVIFRTGLYPGYIGSIPTNEVPKFRASDALQTLLWPFSPKSTKKKVICKKHVFQPLPKTRFSRIKRARRTRATNEQFSQILHRSMHNRTKFQPDRFSRSAQNVFWRRESASFFNIYISRVLNCISGLRPPVSINPI